MTGWGPEHHEALRRARVRRGFTDWDEEKIRELTQAWGLGVPASDIADRLGISKNSIIGKAHRLGLPGRPSPIKRAPDQDMAVRKVRAARRARVVPRLADLVPRDEGLPAASASATLDRHQCLWPVGDERPLRFCGAAICRGSYCADHAEMAYLPRKPNWLKSENAPW